MITRIIMIIAIVIVVIIIVTLIAKDYTPEVDTSEITVDFQWRFPVDFSGTPNIISWVCRRLTRPLAWATGRF